MTLTIIFLSIFSILSAIIIGILVWYSRLLLQRLSIGSRAASNIFTEMHDFKIHLEKVYSLPVFHGEGRVKDLLAHTNHMISICRQYEPIYSFTDPELEEVLLREEQEDDDESSEDIRNAKEEQERKESVFHTATRGRNSRIYQFNGFQA